MALHTYEPGPSSQKCKPVCLAGTALSRRLKDVNEDGDPSRWNPPIDIEELGECFVVRADLPGVEIADIAATLEFGLLKLSGHRNTTFPEQGAGHNVAFIREWFCRQFTLPGSEDGDQVSALFFNGVLVLLIPKLQQHRHRHIVIRN